MGTLYYGDNLTILREHIKDETVDLVYLDPPFNSNASYNVLFRAPDGHESHAQMEAFEDTWHWDTPAEKAFDETIHSGNADAAEMLRAMRAFLHENDMMAYLAMMAVRLLELHRVLKPTGSLYLHCDPTASHYLKILLDAVFGKENFQNEVIWKRTGSHGGSKRWGPLHDTIHFYSKSTAFKWNRVFQDYDESYIEKFYRFEDERGRYRLVTLTGAGTRTGDSGKPWRGVYPTNSGRHWAVPATALREAYPEKDLSKLTTQEKLDLLDEADLVYWPEKGSVPQQKRYSDENPGVQVQDIISDIRPLSSQSQERLGYPTQKPLALLERIIKASSNEGDVVLDPFCGCGTTVHAAQKLNRQWVGIDITHLAISLIQKRLRDAFPLIQIDVIGVPKDLDGARALFEQDPYQFQWWAVSLVDAIPYGGKKRGADSGIDGYIYFKPDAKTTEKAIVSVKGGKNLGVPMIRELANVVDREKAKMGLLITLGEPTSVMRKEAVTAGYYRTEAQGDFAKIQMITIEELLNGKKPQMPWVAPDVFKRAKREMKGEQQKLL